MDYDIDIEEHNIFENPALKAIFPDITVLKQELDYENEVYDTFQTSVINHASNYEGSLHPEDISCCGSSEVIKTPVFKEPSLRQNKTRKIQERDLKLKKDNWFGNRIILSSKPRKKPTNHNVECRSFKLKKAIITLPNVAFTLNNSKMFCKHCSILFPSVQSLIVHNEIMHYNINFNKIEIQSNDENLSESTASKINKLSSNIIETLSNVSCFHCTHSFPDKQTLIEHLYQVLEPKFNKNKVINKDNTSKVQSHTTYANAEEEKPKSKPEHKINVKNSKYINNLKKDNEKWFLQCHICTYYFKNEKFFDRHMYNKHGTNNSSNKVKFKSKCTYCFLHCDDTKSYNKHLYNKHNAEIMDKINKLKNNIKGKSISLQNKSTEVHEENIKDLENTSKTNTNLRNFFQCQVCSYYFRDEKYFRRHMLNKHGIKNTVLRKVKFNPMCIFCSVQCHNNIILYNMHILNRHKANTTRKIFKQNSMNGQDKGLIKVHNKSIPVSSSLKILVPKSTLFKCCKCDMHFVSAKLALNHIEHVEILINWKCSKCSLIFKRNESLLHMKQHEYSQSFSILEMSDDIFAKLLYCCPKCTVHFQEDSFLQHYSCCEDETPQSVHCSTCDILIDSKIKSHHQNSHDKRHINKNDFIVIDLLNDSGKYNNKKKIRKRVIQMKTLKERLKFSDINVQNYHLYYCKTCKCFVSKVHKVNVHRKSQCTQILKYPCRFCGLVLTGKAIMTHRSMHYANKNLKLQQFTFYNLDNGKKICPPMPKYPKCESCMIHFLYKNDLKSHNCGEGINKACSICGILLCEAAYKVHLPFHKYELGLKTSENNDQDLISRPSCLIQSDEIEEELEPNIDSNTNIVERLPPVVYCCKACSTRVDSYDKVIEHCQQHLLSYEVNIIKAESDAHTVSENMKLFNFETFYYGSPNDTWLQCVFGSLSVDHINKLLLNSVYKHESRVKMEVSHEGNPSFTEYKCETCRCFVDCLSLFKHIDNCITNPKKYLCVLCKFPFIVKDTLDKHLQIHRQYHISKSSFRIISFNKAEHEQLNKLIKSNACNPYVVYKCRSCEGLVSKSGFASHICNLRKLKKCDQCGLLLYEMDYESHVLKHKQFNSFTGNNIKVVLLGCTIPGLNKETSVHNNKKSFVGIVCDYSFYKCSKCEVCIRDYRSTSKHFCLIDSAKAKCSKCDLYFDEGKLKGHYKLHSNDSDFVKDNILTITFDPSENKQQTDPKMVKGNHKKKLVDVTKTNRDNIVVVDKESIIEEKVTKIYKCVKCNYHFLSESSAKEHVKKRPGRSLSQQCTKCGFAFSPNNLFKHLLEHHGKKNIVYRFEVVDVTGDFKKQKIYKCLKCNLHFINSKKMYDHHLKCLGDSADGQECKCCGIMFHFSCLLNHERIHEKNTHVDYEVVTIEDVNSC